MAYISSWWWLVAVDNQETATHGCQASVTFFKHMLLNLKPGA